MRTGTVSALAALCLAPVALLAQGVAIEHDPVGCIVAGQFPKLSACFTPREDLSRARVYFRGGTDGPWYWVEFKPDTPCFSAILPKPTRQLKAMSYYVEASDRQYHEARTADRLVTVVPEKGGCSKDLPVAAWVEHATVSVGSAAGAPGVPAGFVGLATSGIGPGTIVGGVLGLGGLTAGGLALSGGDDATPTPTPIPAATSTPTPTAAPTPTPTPTPVPTTPPPFNFVVSVSPSSGLEPLSVTFDACGSTGTNLKFGFDYDGDGIDDQRGPCRVTRTFTLSGVTYVPPPSPTTRVYNSKVTVWEAVGGGQTQSQTFAISVSDSAPSPGCSAPGPTSDVIEPAPGAVLSTSSETLTANASDPDGVQGVKFWGQPTATGPGAELLGVATSPGPTTFSTTWTISCATTPGTWNIWAVAYDVCGNAGPASAPVQVDVSLPCLSPPRSLVQWRSQLEVPGGSATLVQNGGATYSLAAGSTSGEIGVKPHFNRIDLVLTRGTGPGLWRFEIDEPGWDPATLQVLSGTLASQTRSGVVFRLEGVVGERVSFVFEPGG